MNSLLKTLRQRKGYTQQYMAQKLGYKSKSGYCMLEKGLIKLTVEKAKDISKILDVEPEIFFTEKVQETSTKQPNSIISNK